MQGCKGQASRPVPRCVCSGRLVVHYGYAYCHIRTLPNFKLLDHGVPIRDPHPYHQSPYPSAIGRQRKDLGPHGERGVKLGNVVYRPGTWTDHQKRIIMMDFLDAHPAGREENQANSNNTTQHKATHSGKACLACLSRHTLAWWHYATGGCSRHCSLPILP